VDFDPTDRQHGLEPTQSLRAPGYRHLIGRSGEVSPLRSWAHAPAPVQLCGAPA
jgi:hypothetical protein